MKKKDKPKPFLKWAGGKTQLLSELESHLPEKIRRAGVIDCYLEPFVGGGAFFFYLKSRYKVPKAYLIDNNPDLILAYNVVKREPEKLIERLLHFEKKYTKQKEQARTSFYYEIREKYNGQRLNFDYDTFSGKWIERAAYLIFLNKTCFNGLYRLNARGDFNVPHGRYKNPGICNAENIRAVSEALANTHLICADFSKCRDYVQKDSLVYFDPPYRPISITSNFTGYTKTGFPDSEQLRLAALCRELADRGVYVLLSNSDSANEGRKDKFFDKIYSGFNIERVLANRMINCNGQKRGRIQELLIANY